MTRKTDFYIFWKEELNKLKVKRTSSKLLKVVLEEKRREMIKEWIDL